MTAMSFVRAVAGTLVHSSPGCSLRRRKTLGLPLWIGQGEEGEGEVPKTLLIGTTGAVSLAQRLIVRGPRSVPIRKT